MVDFSSVWSVLGGIGDKIGYATSFIVQWLASLGLQVTPDVAKAIWIFIALLGSYAVVKLMQKPLKWTLLLLLLFIIISLGASWIK